MDIIVLRVHREDACGLVSSAAVWTPYRWWVSSLGGWDSNGVWTWDFVDRLE